MPALEIVDSAIADWKITLVDTVADNASSGLYVLGHQPVAIGQLAGAELGMQMSVNGAVASVGSGAACLGHPLRAAYWLARTMAARGQPLRAGEVMLSGALGPMVPAAAGDWVRVRIDGVGQCSVRFARRRALPMKTLGALAAVMLTAGATAARPPNIVFVLLDDAGFSDLGSYGGEITTPHIDTLARQGVRFSNFHTAADLRSVARDAAFGRRQPSGWRGRADAGDRRKPEGPARLRGLPQRPRAQPGPADA